MRYFGIFCAFMGSLALALNGSAAPLVPDNGSGTAFMPIRLDYLSETPLHIINGLPVGTQVNIDGKLTAPTGSSEQVGGSLGGTQSAATGSGLDFVMTGTGALAAYNRSLTIPLNTNVASFPPGGNPEVHAAPRTNFNPVQSFNTDMFRLFGQITGDPDFDLLRVVSGTDFGLPSPGHTTLTQSGGNWEVDSFFDVFYRIDFVGKPGGTFGGMSGSTTGTVRISVPEPASLGLLLPAAMMLARRSRRR